MLLYIKCHSRWSCTCGTCQSPWVLKLATSMKNWIWLTFSPTFLYPIDQTFEKRQHVNELWVEIVLKFKCWLLSKPLKEVKVTKLHFLSKYYIHQYHSTIWIDRKKLSECQIISWKKAKSFSKLKMVFEHWNWKKNWALT